MRHSSQWLADYEARQKPVVREAIPATEKFEAKSEKELQKLVRNYLALHGFWFTQSAMSKATTCKVGQPDFLICAPGGKFAFIECKSPTGRVRPEQEQEMAALRLQGAVGIVCRDFIEAKRFLDELL